MGAIIRINAGHWETIPDGGDQIRLAIEEFEIIGGEGCTMHGEPRDLNGLDSMSKLVEQHLREPACSIGNISKHDLTI